MLKRTFPTITAAAAAFLFTFSFVITGVRQRELVRGFLRSSAPCVVQQAPTTTTTNSSTRSSSISSGAETSTFSQHRKTLYRYVTPYSRTGEQAREARKECGGGPDFTSFFKQEKQVRSAVNEDKVIYERFFKDLSPEEMKGATYVEIGGFDGMDASNSRFFDQCLGWDGLLVEAAPKVFPRLATNRPHAHRMSFAPSCSIKEEAQNKTIVFSNVIFGNAAQIFETNNAYKDVEDAKKVDVPCGSLTPVLLDLFPGGNVTFFSLDVEGAEPLILGNIDFDQVFIEVVIAESKNNFCKKACESRDKARAIMKDAGYSLYPDVVSHSDLYVHKRSKFVAKML